MAAYEILLLNTSIPQIQAAQSGDTYVVPRDIAFSAALTLSAGTANGVPYLNGSKVLTTGSALTFDGTTFKSPILFASSTDAGGTVLQVDTTSTAYGRIGGSTTMGYVAGTQTLWTIGGSEGMRLTSTGLGIGTSSPAYKLDVAGTVRIGSGGSIQPILSRSGTSGGLIINTTAASAAGPLAVQDNGVDRLVIDASGNLGLGVTPTTVSNNKNLEIGGANNAAIILSTSSNNAAARNLAIASNFSAYGDLVFLQSNAVGGNPLTAGTQRMTLDASGQLIVGNTAAAGSSQITAYGATNGQIAVQNSTNWSRMLQNGSDVYIDNSVGGSAGNIIFRNSSSTVERARITSGGDLLVGGHAAALFGEKFSVVAGAQNGALFKNTNQPDNVALFWNASTTGDAQFCAFATESSYTGRGTISYNRVGGLVAYNTTSDYRAKDILGPVQNPGATIDALKVYEGKMKGATQSRPMLVAHEAQEHAPYAVTGEKDAVNEDGTPKYQQMDVSSLVPLLLAEIQSLRARVAQLEGK